jgi:hypothetical protein
VPKQSIFDWAARYHATTKNEAVLLLQETSAGDHAQAMTIAEADHALAAEMSFTLWALDR